MPQAKLALVSDATVARRRAGSSGKTQSQAVTKLRPVHLGPRLHITVFAKENYSIAIQQNEAILAASLPVMAEWLIPSPK